MAVEFYRTHFQKHCDISLVFCNVPVSGNKNSNILRCSHLRNVFKSHSLNGHLLDS